MATGGFEYTFNANHNLVMEGVFTKNDINTFSPYDSYNDEGYGYKLKSLNKSYLQKDTNDKVPVKMVYNLNYEYLQQNFTQVERFRSIEFQRDWNRPYVDAINTDQHIGSVEVGIEKANRYRLLYGFNTFQEGSFFTGYKQQLGANYTKGKFISDYNGSYLTTNNNPINTEFYRHKSLISQGLGKVRLTLSDEFENNIFKSSLTNTIMPRTYQFWDWEASISNTDSTKNKIKLFYRERRDKQAYGKEIKDSTYAQNIGMQLGIYSMRNHPITFYFTYRELHLKNIVGTSLKPDNTLLSRF
jgi:lysozyme family protein